MCETEHHLDQIFSSRVSELIWEFGSTGYSMQHFFFFFPPVIWPDKKKKKKKKTCIKVSLASLQKKSWTGVYEGHSVRQGRAITDQPFKQECPQSDRECLTTWLHDQGKGPIWDWGTCELASVTIQQQKEIWA